MNKKNGKKNGKKTAVKVTVVLSIIAIVIVGGFVLLRNAGRNALANRIDDKMTEIGGSGNVETLKRLNDQWTLPEGYILEVVETGDMKMEWLLPEGTKPEKAILQLHGGSYTRSLEDTGNTHRRAAAQYASISGAAVLTPDYRVAPEHPYPAALEDALTAYEWLLAQGYDAGSIIVAGDSAGGGLTLALTLYLRDNERPLPAALITMSPWTNLNYRRYTPPYVGKSRADDPYISPVYGEYDGFPPMLMQVGGDEALLDDTLNVAKKASDAGAAVTQTTYPGMFHVFQMLFPELSEANEAWEEVRIFIHEVFEYK